MDPITCIQTFFCNSQTLRDAADEGLSFLRSWLGNLLCFRRNVAALDTGMAELSSMRSEILEGLSAQEVSGKLGRKPTVVHWLDSEEKLQRDINQFKSTVSAQGGWIPQCCGCGCLCSSCELGDLQWQIRDLKSQKDKLGQELVCPVEPPAVGKPRSNSVNTATFASQVDQIMDYLKNEPAGSNIVGIYGMCGVGKTELLTAVHSHLYQWSEEANPLLSFQKVIHVDLKKRGQLGEPDSLITDQEEIKLAIQTEIRNRLGLSQEDDLSLAIRDKRCLLLIDHVGDALDWTKIGIPEPNPGLKVVFATVSKSVCDDMKAWKSVKVEYLDKDASWNLFCSSMKERNKETWNSCKPNVKKCAKRVVSMCGGVPGAIIAVARGLMLNITTRDAWDRIEQKLRHSPHEVRGMLDLFTTLKRSFDRLQSRPLKMAECLLYCSLFPESGGISKEQLIDYWIGEGFLDEMHGASEIGEVRSRGSDVIGELQEACLLETGVGNQREVKLHNVVRHMALWLTHDDAKKFLTSTRPGASASASWKKAMRISLMDSDNKVLPPGMSEGCPQLQTLLLNNYAVDLYGDTRCTIHSSAFDDLFKLLPALRVLDLSGTDITSLPESVGSLDKLKYLNMSHTNIASLPKELKKLEQLRLLNLRNTPHLSRIPQEVISSLNKLQTLDVYCSSYRWSREEHCCTVNGHVEWQASLGDLVSVNSALQELGISIRTLPDLQALVAGMVWKESSKGLNPDVFWKPTRFLSLDGVEGLTEEYMRLVIDSMRMLLELSISRCPDLVKLEFRLKKLTKLKVLSLRDLPALSMIAAETGSGDESPLPCLQSLQIRKCHQLKDLTCIKEFPDLQEVSLISCNGIQELIASPMTPITGEEVPLSDLRKISLEDLPSCNRFSDSSWFLPSIEHIKVSKSMNLKKLPLEPRNLETMKEICGEQAWWNKLDWYQGGNADFHAIFKSQDN